MQRGVHARLLDSSTSVREAAVELVGKFILNRPDLISQYYSMLSDRILDTGISVRKRVIKIFRDICVEQPDFEKIPEMCVKMIRRVNDEEGIKVGRRLTVTNQHGFGALFSTFNYCLNSCDGVNGSMLLFIYRNW